MDYFPSCYFPTDYFGTPMSAKETIIAAQNDYLAKKQVDDDAVATLTIATANQRQAKAAADSARNDLKASYDAAVKALADSFPPSTDPLPPGN